MVLGVYGKDHLLWSRPLLAPPWALATEDSLPPFFHPTLPLIHPLLSSWSDVFKAHLITPCLLTSLEWLPRTFHGTSEYLVMLFWVFLFWVNYLFSIISPVLQSSRATYRFLNIPTQAFRSLPECPLLFVHMCYRLVWIPMLKPYFPM